MNFKAGDWVYCPSFIGGEVRQLESSGDEIYPLCFRGEQTFMSDGRLFSAALTPSILHATPENKGALQVLYPNIEFQDPPKQKIGSDLTRELLEKYGKSVWCWVSDVSDVDAIDSKRHVRLIQCFDSEDETFRCEPSTWRYAVPIPRSVFLSDDFTFPPEVQP